jgi:hypothetical protein
MKSTAGKAARERLIQHLPSSQITDCALVLPVALSF